MRGYMAAATEELVDSLEARWARLETEFHHAWWDSQVDVTPENEARRTELELELRRAKGDPGAFKAVTQALDRPIEDPLLRRRLETMRLSLTANQMDEETRAEIVSLSSSVESDFAAHRPVVDGRPLSDNDIDSILRESDDSAVRQRVWEASKEVGAAVAERVRRLAHLRNKAARELGYDNYYVMELDLQELSQEWLFDTLESLDELTAASFERWKTDLDARMAQRFGVKAIRPWHYADPFFQQLPPDGAVSLDGLLGTARADKLAEDTFGRWGIDLSPVMRQSDLWPRDRKSQHAFCIQIDRSQSDVRILANIVPGERWVETMLHESGHAAYDVSIAPDLPYLLRRPAHIFVTEAMAILSGRLVNDGRWLQNVAGMPAERVHDIEGGLQRATSSRSMLFARWGLVMVHFERHLYEDPDGDLDTLWWDLVERFQSVARPPGRSQPDWAAKLHIAAAPVYYHNYLLGEMLASQLRFAAERDCGPLVDAAETGEWLTSRLFYWGSSRRWEEVVREAAGEPLTARDFAADLDR
jgi:peptidyl-dipeptidase A